MLFKPETLRVNLPPPGKKKMPNLPKNPAEKKPRKRRKTSKKVLRENAQNQTRNSDGTFAKVGGFLDRIFTRKPARKKKKLPPLPERNLGQKLVALANGSATKYVRNQARNTSPILRESEPKRRKRRRRKTA